MKKKIGISTKKQIMLIIAVFVMPLIIVVFIYNFYSVNILNDRIAQNNKKNIYIYERALDGQLHSIENSMADMLANDPNYVRLNYKLNSVEAYLCGYNLIEKYKVIMNTYKDVSSGYFIYNETYNVYNSLYNTGNKYEYETKNKIENYLKKLTKEQKDCSQWGWFVHKIDEKNYLFRVLNYNNSYSIAMIDFENTVKPQDSQDNAENEFLLYSSLGGEPLTLADFIAENGIELKPECDSYYITGEVQKYLVVQNRMDYGNFNMVYVMPYKGFLKNLDVMQLWLLVASVLIVLLLPYSYYLLKSSFFEPLNRLVETMNYVKEGNIEAKMSDNYRIEEFLQVSKTFNEMITQIKLLKIEAYEKKMEAQKAQLQYLQIQIRPHFFLNCLKNLYGMAEQKNYGQIQEMILVLSDYMRNMFKNNPVVVPLSEELESVKYYIKLQQMSAFSPPVCNINIDADLMNFLIPPLSILTFIENSVKHAACHNKQLIITIRAALLKNGEEDYVNITILDNGQGFSDEMLEVLNDEKDAKLVSNIGISNVKRRFSLIYNDKSTFLFNQSNGACVEIFIPYESNKT